MAVRWHRPGVIRGLLVSSSAGVAADRRERAAQAVALATWPCWRPGRDWPAWRRCSSASQSGRPVAEPAATKRGSVQMGDGSKGSRTI